MTNQYGPWATLIDAGGNPQLSAFWRRRLTMLVPTSQTSPVLSRRNLLGLVAMGVMMIALPTFRSASIAAEEEKPATAETKPSASALEEHFCSVGPSPFYVNMKDSELVAKIGLTPEQRKQLDELAQKNSSEMLQAYREADEKLQKFLKELQSLPKETGEERAKRLWPDYVRGREKWRAQNKKDTRKKIEALLTPEQLQTVKDLAYPELAFSELQDAKTLQRIGTTAEQEEKLRDLHVETSRLHQQVVFDKAEQWPSIFSPEQQAKLREEAQRRIDKEVAARRAGNRFGCSATGLAAVLLIGDENRIPSHPELACALVRKRLKFSEDQERRLCDVVAKLPAREMELMKSALNKSATKQNDLSTAEYDKLCNQLLMENRKQLVEENRKQIETILTPQQLSALNDFLLHKEMATALFGQDTLKTIGATEQHRAKLRQLFEEARKEEDRIWREASRRAVNLLTPHKTSCCTKSSSKKDGGRQQPFQRV